MRLHCASCGMPHDLDLAPDEGVCTHCGGQLVEDDSEVGAHLVAGVDIMQLVSDGLTAAMVARGKVDRGSN